jgi:STE24 endopeptidase
MRPALVLGVLLFASLALWTMRSRSPEREARALRYFSAEEVARGKRFAGERRLLFWSSEAAQLGLLGWLAVSGSGALWATRCDALTGGRWWATLLLVGAALFLAQELVSLPWSVYGGFIHLRAWGLTDRSFSSWAVDHLKGLAISGLLGGLLLLCLFGLMRFAPRSWWLFAGLGSALFGVFMAYLAPVLIAPLFNSFVPLRDTKHAALLPEIQALARRAALRVDDVLVMDASRQGRHTNAYFTGFFGTRRIVLYDTLLQSHGEQETLSVLAHEVGHWRRHHIAKGIALGGTGALLGFWLLARILERAGATADARALPLLLLLASLGGLLSLPLQNAFSRAFEREADQDALDLYGHPEAFIEAEKRLARDNIANVAPADVNVFLFASHPPTLERIAMAERRQ